MKRFPAFAAAFLTVLSLAGCGNLSAPQNEDICPGKQVGAEGVPVMKAEGFDETEVWGDRIFEKCGIGRDERGDGGKTLEIRGKRRLSARDGGANYQQS